MDDKYEVLICDAMMSAVGVDSWARTCYGPPDLHGDAPTRVVFEPGPFRVVIFVYRGDVELVSLFVDADDAVVMSKALARAALVAKAEGDTLEPRPRP